MTTWLTGGGEMGALIRSRDWSRTPLGPLEGWQQSLRTAVGMLLASRAQIILFWGPDFIVLYNDAYRPVFGGKHPDALGLPGREAWSEIWEHQLGPLLEGVVRTGDAYWATDLLFAIQRHGYLEETYFDISYDPVRDESGKVAGVYCIVTETTGRVTGARRLRTLTGMGRISLNARTLAGTLERAADVLGEDPEDIAFTLLYEWDARAATARLRATAGIDPGHPALTAAWPLVPTLPSEGVVLDAATLGLPALPGGRWPEPSMKVAVVPIAMPSQPPDAFLVAGTSPRHAIDPPYRDFLRLVAAGIASALASAKALVAERERVEALAELDRVKTAFFSNVSHEFRTPLTLLLGPLQEEIAGEELTKGSRERLQVAHRNGVRLLKLVNALLDFSRIEAGRMRARYESTQIALFTSELASNFSSACVKAGLDLRVDCEPLGAPAFVDRDMWEKIVLNLISNAFKFTFDGGIHITLREREGCAVLSVRDTGVGIEPAEMPRLFERFHRIEGVRARTHEGSGIGLALVQELVRMHGGEIRAQSRPGQGSHFEVSIPLGSGHLPPGQVVAASGHVAGSQAPMFVQEALEWLRGPRKSLLVDVPSAAPGARRERVLVADDNADMREYIEHLLGDSWEVTAVADGEEALHSLYTERFDLLLTDVMMPRMDGFQLLKVVRGDETLRDMPVIMISARAGEEARIEGREAGADDYLVKPFSARELVAQVRAQLATARARKAFAREREVLLAGERSARMDAERQWEDLVQLFEQAPNPMLILRGNDYVIELVNPATCQVWGRSREDVIHTPLFDAIPEVRGQGLEALLDGVMQTGNAHHGQRQAVPLASRGADEESMYFDFVYSPLRGKSGRVEGVAVIALQVRREELEAAREES
jgi:signal transduction histidine kinase/DNA-binding NarL/FixJ family response regulator